MWRAMGAQVRLWRVYRAAVRASAQFQMPAGDLGTGLAVPAAGCLPEHPSSISLSLKLTLLLYSLQGPLVWHMWSCS